MEMSCHRAMSVAKVSAVDENENRRSDKQDNRLIG